MEPFYTVPQVAEILGVSDETVYRDIRAGRMRAVLRRGCSRGMRVPASELERWAAEEWAEAYPHAPTRRAT